MKNTERFSDRAENYVRYRPHYPPAIIPFLQKDIGLKKNWVVADIGSGTGISTELFLKNENTVYAVEPNKPMRDRAEEAFKKKTHFNSIDATAENTTLADASINMIVSGQAFHWFDKAAAKAEFLRIAAPGAYLVLMWNDRKMDSDFLKAYEQMLFDFAPAYEDVCYRNIDKAAIDTFFSPNPYYLKLFSNVQHFDLEGLKGRLLSSSYAPQEHQETYQPIMHRLAQIYEEFKESSGVAFEYDCKIFYGKIK